MNKLERLNKEYNEIVEQQVRSNIRMENFKKNINEEGFIIENNEIKENKEVWVVDYRVVRNIEFSGLRSEQIYSYWEGIQDVSESKHFKRLMEIVENTELIKDELKGKFSVLGCEYGCICDLLSDYADDFREYKEEIKDIMDDIYGEFVLDEDIPDGELQFDEQDDEIILSWNKVRVSNFPEYSLAEFNLVLRKGYLNECYTESEEEIY